MEGESERHTNKNMTQANVPILSISSSSFGLFTHIAPRGGRGGTPAAADELSRPTDASHDE
jgi:hypothetical protein